MDNRFAAVLGTLWDRRWWMLGPTVLTAVLTGVLSYYFLPARYRSEATIRMVSARVPADVVRTDVTGRLRERGQQLNLIVLSHTRLDRIITEFGLYQDELETAPRDEVIKRMREEDIHFALLTADQAEGNDLAGVSVGFVSSDPTTALKVTERLASILVQQNQQENQLHADSIIQFINAQIDDVRRRITEYEDTLENRRARNGGRPLSQADLLPYEVLQETYRTLLVKAEESRMAANLERRHIGAQLRVVDFAQRPVGPSRVGVNVAGTLAGLGIGLVLVMRRRSEQPF